MPEQLPTAALHEFMADHRDEVLAQCHKHLRENAGDRADKPVDGLGAIVDDIIGALQKHAGLPVESPLPGESASAIALGENRLQRGFPIKDLAIQVGSISVSIGEVGSRYHLSFSADDYQVFNECIDSVISAAVDQYWQSARAQIEDETQERLGFLAHELRNALGAARMSFDLMQSGQVAMSGRTASIHVRSLALLESLIGKMLLASRLQADVPPELVPVEVRQVLDEVVDATFLERGIDVKVAADPELRVMADKRLLTSAVSNLLQNAVKFSRANGHVVLRAREEPSVVSIEIEDECGGLPPGRAEELFEPHVQRSGDHRGFGLGLAITKEAIERQHGSIAVRDLPGKGCVFRVELPRADA